MTDTTELWDAVYKLQDALKEINDSRLLHAIDLAKCAIEDYEDENS